MRYPVLEALIDYELAEHLCFLFLLLMLGGALAGLFVMGLLTLVPPGDQLGRIGQALLGVVLAFGAAWIVLYATGPDGYYVSGLSRWGHAARWGKTSEIRVSLAFAGITSIVLLLNAVVPRPARLRLLAVPAGVLSCLLLLMSWFFLTGGH